MLVHCVDGTEITYSSSYNSHTPVSFRRRRHRREVVDDPLDDLDLDDAFDPEVIIITSLVTYLKHSQFFITQPIL